MNYQTIVSTIQKTKSWSFLCSLLLALMTFSSIMLFTTNPLQVGPNGILLFFTLLYAIGVVISLLILKAGKSILKKRLSGIKSMYLAATVAFGPTMVIALSSLGQLQILDVALVVIFEALALFYIARRLV